MKPRWKKLSQRMMAAILASAMSLSLAMSPLPGMIAEYKGEIVRAAEDNSTQDAIYLPITIRDAKPDEYIFEKGVMTTNGPVEAQLSETNTPAYNETAIKTLAQRIKDLKGIAKGKNYTNTYDGKKTATRLKRNAQLETALTNQITDWSTVNAPSKTYSAELNKAENKGYVPFTYVKNCYDAAHWMWNNIFNDGSFDGDMFEGGSSIDGMNANAVADLYMFKSNDFNSMVLKKATTVYTFNNLIKDKNGNITVIEKEYDPKEKNYYLYESCDPKLNASGATSTTNERLPRFTKYDTVNKLIENVPNNDNNDPMVQRVNNYGAWFPLEGLGFKEEYISGGTNEHQNVNCCTTLAGSGNFVYRAEDDLFFGFIGDDDVYLYINKKLVINNGGFNNKTPCFIDLEDVISAPLGTADTIEVGGKKYNNPFFADLTNATYKDAEGNTREVVFGKTTWKEYLELEEGEIYDFHFFQIEREGYGSAFSIYTNIRVSDPMAVTKKVAYQNGQELASGAYVAQNSEVSYGFEIKNNDTELVNYKNIVVEDAKLGVVISKNDLTLGTVDGTTGGVTRKIEDIEYAIVNENESVAESGKFTTEDELKSFLAAGKNGTGINMEPGQTLVIRGFKYNVGEQDVFENLVNTATTCTTEKSSIPRTIYGSATMNLKTTSFATKSFVIDYAKEMSVTKSDVFGGEGNSELEGFDVNSTIGTISLKDEKGEFGTMNLDVTKETSEYLTYIPTKFINGIDRFDLIVPITTENVETNETSTTNMTKVVNIVPANNIYYEDDIVSTSDTSVGIVYSGGNWTVDGSTTGNKEVVNTDIHGGWENVDLANDTKYSDGSAHTSSTHGATATFTFTGTGVDVYSRTHGDVGFIQAELYAGKGTDSKNLLAVQVIDNLSESGDYYQIPTLAFEKEYGTYTVKLLVGAKTKTDADGNTVFDDAGNKVKRATYYLDGIRVYNPLGENDELYSVKEQDAVFTKVRDILLDAKNFSSDQSEVVGAVFIDSVDDDNAYDDTGVITTDVLGTYREDGPKNEVYLDYNQSIVFKVNPDKEAYYYVGLKSPTGDIDAFVINGTATTKKAIKDIKSTDVYYEVKPDANGYIVITNAGKITETVGDDGQISVTTADNGGLLSITKLRTTACIDDVTGKAINNVMAISAEEATVQVMSLRSRPLNSQIVEPEDPEDPVDPENPVEPEDPVDPENPVDPEDPVEPEKPGNSNKPGNSDKPNDNGGNVVIKPSTPSWGLESLFQGFTNMFNKFFGGFENLFKGWWK